MSNDVIIWSPGITLEWIEKQVVLKAFTFYRGNKTATANSLGIAIRTLDNKLEKYEADKKVEEQRHAGEQQKRRDFLARQRNGTPAAVAETPVKVQEKATSDGALAGVRVEPASKSAPQSPVPLSERPKIQTVLPKDNAKSDHKKSR